MRRAMPYPCCFPRSESVFKTMRANVPCQTSVFSFMIVSILHRFLNAIDDEDAAWPFGGLQFQPKMLLNRSDHCGKRVGIGRLTPIGAGCNFKLHAEIK